MRLPAAVRSTPPLFLFLPLVLLFASGCGPTRTYEVKGRVVGFGDDGRTVIIDHEDIPGLMPSMTMPFRTTEPAAIQDLAHGQAVQFRLVVAPDSAWIDRIERLPDSAVAPSPDGTNTARPRAPEGTPLLEAGDPVPPFELVDQNGETVRLSDYEGQALLINFIYTRCPLPQYCPLLAQHFQTLQPRLQERFGDRVQLLSISIDPAYDTPKVLREYARRYKPDPDVWTFATGTPEQIALTAHRFGVFYEPQGDEVMHNLVTALVGPDGRLQQTWRGNRWKPDEVLAAIDFSDPAQTHAAER